MGDFVKLSSLVNDTFTVEDVGGYKFQMWDNENKTMLKSDTYVKGYRKVYPVTTDKGQLDLGAGQLGNLLEAVFDHGQANLRGVTFEVKSNMTPEQFASASREEKLKVRYFFNPVKQRTEVRSDVDDFDPDPSFGGF